MENSVQLSELSLTAEEKCTVQQDLTALLHLIDRMNEIDTENVSPLIEVGSLKNVTREDRVTEPDGSAATLSHAPERTENCFVVPKTIVREEQ